MKTITKKEYGYLIALICFYIGAIASFFSDLDNKVVFGSSFALIGIAFTVKFATQMKKAKK